MEGLTELHAALERAMTDVSEGARTVVVRSAAIVEAAAKKNFEGAHKKGRPHVGGDKPNVVTGTLRRSIRSDAVSAVGLGEYVTKVGPSTVYGRRVELGFKGSKGYPYFAPGVNSTRGAVAAAAEQVWRGVLHI